jgi:hypothetical protein
MKPLLTISIFFIIISFQGIKGQIKRAYDYDSNIVVKKVTENPSGIYSTTKEKEFLEFGNWNLPARYVKYNTTFDSIVYYNWFAYKLTDFKKLKSEGYKLLDKNDVDEIKDKVHFDVWVSKSEFKDGQAAIFNPQITTKYGVKNMEDKEILIYQIQTEEGYYANLNESYFNLTGDSVIMNTTKSYFSDHFQEFLSLKDFDYYWEYKVYSKSGNVLFDSLYHPLFTEKNVLFESITKQLNTEVKSWAENNMKLMSNNSKFPVTNYHNFYFSIHKNTKSSNSIYTFQRNFKSIFENTALNTNGTAFFLPKKAKLYYEEVEITGEVPGKSFSKSAFYAKSLELPRFYGMSWIGSFAGIGYDNVTYYSSSYKKPNILKYGIWGTGGLACLTFLTKAIAYNSYLKNPYERQGAYNFANFSHKTALVSSLLYCTGVTLDIVKTVKMIKRTKLKVDQINAKI